jgi:peptidoglycan/LPS O-acetylase OafA/YrhL
MKRGHVVGLDSLRFVAAAVVALSHGAMFPLSAYTHGVSILRLPTGLYDNAFNSIAAVLVFFVISGFCIEYPFACGAGFRTAPFLTRRVLRISIPLIVVWVTARIAGETTFFALKLVLWSLYCELFYYVTYPALRLVIHRFGFMPVFVAISLVSLGLAALFWDVQYYWELPPIVMFIVGWPIWLAGCGLAKAVAEGWSIRLPGTIWTWRTVMWVCATAGMVFEFHGQSKIGFPLSHWPLAGLIVAWIYREITHFAAEGASPFLESCGKASYSLYLVHNPVIIALNGVAPEPAAQWLLQVSAIIVATLIFYTLIELPAHRFARLAANSITAGLAVAR